MSGSNKGDILNKRRATRRAFTHGSCRCPGTWQNDFGNGKRDERATCGQDDSGFGGAGAVQLASVVRSTAERASGRLAVRRGIGKGSVAEATIAGHHHRPPEETKAGRGSF